MVRSHNRRLLIVAAAVGPLTMSCSTFLVDSEPEVLRSCRATDGAGPCLGTGTACRPRPHARCHDSRAVGRPAAAPTTVAP